jgi:hypothetical protein
MHKQRSLLAFLLSGILFGTCGSADVWNEDVRYETWPFASKEDHESGHLLDAFLEWVRRRTHITVNPSVRITLIDSFRRYGVLANTNIDNFAILTITPSDDMLCGSRLTPEDLQAEKARGLMPSIINEHITEVSEEDGRALTFLDPSILNSLADNFYLKLIRELLIGNESRWYPYIRILPSDADFKEYMPQYWSSDAVSLWQATTLPPSTNLLPSKQSAAQLEVEVMSIYCSRYGKQASPLMRRVLCDSELHQWAFTVMVTRSWGPHSRTCLIPVADMFNHGSEGNSLATVGIDSGAIYTATIHREGDELTQTYRADLTHEEFFLVNGFSVLDGRVPLSPIKVPKEADIQSSDWCKNGSTPSLYVSKPKPGGGQCSIAAKDLLCLLILYGKQSTSRINEIQKRYYVYVNQTEHLITINGDSSMWINARGDRGAWRKIKSDLKERTRALKRFSLNVIDALKPVNPSRAVLSIIATRRNEYKASQICLAAVKSRINLNKMRRKESKFSQHNSKHNSENTSTLMSGENKHSKKDNASFSWSIKLNGRRKRLQRRRYDASGRQRRHRGDEM